MSQDQFKNVGEARQAILQCLETLSMQSPGNKLMAERGTDALNAFTNERVMLIEELKAAKVADSGKTIMLEALLPLLMATARALGMSKSGPPLQPASAELNALRPIVEQALVISMAASQASRSVLDELEQKVSEKQGLAEMKQAVVEEAEKFLNSLDTNQPPPK